MDSLTRSRSRRCWDECRHAARYRRLRELVHRVIRERRDLNRRIELVCRDLVEAHRRLVHRVVESEGMRSSHSV